MAKRRKKERKKKRNERCDIKGRENAGSYDNYEKGRKKRLGVRRLVKWNRGRERRSFISSTDGISLFIRFFAPYIFFLPRGTTDHSINGPPMIQLRRGKNGGSVHSIWFLGMLLRETKILQFIRLYRIRFVFFSQYFSLCWLDHAQSHQFFASKSIGKFLNDISRRMESHERKESFN